MTGKSIKMSLIERSAVTFDSFLEREFASRFYNEEFLSGITARRLEIVTKMQKTGGAAIAFAGLMAFFDLISGRDISYAGFSIQISKEILPIFSFMAASALMQTAFAFVDDQIIFRILVKIGNRIQIQNFPLLLVDRMAHNLWGEAMVPRVFGVKSGVWQSISVFVFSALMLLITFLMFMFPAIMIVKNFYDTITTDSQWVAIAISSLALSILVTTICFGIIFAVNFTFHPADWHESTNRPTDDFARRMRRDIGLPEDPTDGT